MATILSDTNLITKEECSVFQKTMAEKIDKIAEGISDIKTDMTAIKVDIACLPQAIFEKGDNRYASKTVERAVYALIGIIVFAVMGALLAQVLK
jgi:hypothetical protein